MARHRIHRRYGRSGLKVRPLHIWIEDIKREAGIYRPELDTPEWRKRFRLWYDTGETVEGGAEMLRMWPWPKHAEPPVGPEFRALRERMAKLIEERKKG